MTMTEERRKMWQTYVDHIAQVLGRANWRIKLSPEPTVEGASADVWVQDNHEFARIRLDPDWESESSEHRRYIVTHELLHLHFHRANAVLDQVEPFMTAREFTLLDKTYCDAFECGIDSLAYAVAALLPLPEKVVPALRSKPRPKASPEP